MTEERLVAILAQHEHDRPCRCVADLVAEVRRLQVELQDARIAAGLRPCGCDPAHERCEECG